MKRSIFAAHEKCVYDMLTIKKTRENLSTLENQNNVSKGSANIVSFFTNEGITIPTPFYAFVFS